MTSIDDPAPRPASWRTVLGWAVFIVTAPFTLAVALLIGLSVLPIVLALWPWAATWSRSAARELREQRRAAPPFGARPVPAHG